MSMQALPVLLEDGSRYDWYRAEYEPEVLVEPTRASVTHRLRHASTLERLVEEGLAKWATELRCPKTLTARVEEAAGDRQDITWAPEEVDGEVFIIPGLLAVKDFGMHPKMGDLSPIWEEREFDVRRGWWLARGAARRTETLGQSLLKFKVDEKLPPGRMNIECFKGTEDFYFHIHLATDIWEERTARHVQVAALIGALGHMPVQFKEGEDEPRVVEEVRQRLEREGVPVWTDSDFDPARAATAIEPFHPVHVSDTQAEAPT